MVKCCKKNSIFFSFTRLKMFVYKYQINSKNDVIRLNWKKRIICLNWHPFGKASFKHNLYSSIEYVCVLKNVSLYVYMGI